MQPILFASGTHEVNQVFFENVRVPKSNIVGEENQGWKVAKYLLEFERGGGGAAGYKTNLKKLKQFSQTIMDGESPLIQDPSFKTKLDAAEVQIEAIQLTEWRVMAQLSKGASPGPETTIKKNHQTNKKQYLTNLIKKTI